MTSFLGATAMRNISEDFRQQAITKLVISCSTIIPMASVLVGYAATFSQDLEKNAPLRFKLFGYKEREIFISKLIAELILVTISLILYFVVDYFTLKYELPNFGAAIILTITIYILTIIFFVFAHGIALLFKKFAPTFSVTMIIYFGMMILSGLFGVEPDNFPKLIRNLAYCFPTTYIKVDFYCLWKGDSYNAAPFIQSIIFSAVVSVLVIMYAFYKNNRNLAGKR